MGKTYREVRNAIEQSDGVTVIGYLRWEGDGDGLGMKRPVVTLNPRRTAPEPDEPAPIDYRLAADDELFVVARPEAYAALRAGRLPNEGRGRRRAARSGSEPRAADAPRTPSPGAPGSPSKE